MRKLSIAGGVLALVTVAMAGNDTSNINDTFNINVSIPEYCEFASTNLNEDIEFSVKYFDGKLSHVDGTTTNNYQFRCIQGTTFTISATSINGGKLIHETDSNYYITYQLGGTVYDSNFNTIGASADLFTNSISATANNDNLNLGINAVNLNNFPENPLAGTYTDTVTLEITY